MTGFWPGATAMALAALTFVSQGGRERLTDAEIREVRELVAAADRAMTGAPGGPGESLDFQAHFLRAPDGRTYVPFTVSLEDLPGEAFSSVGLYVRVARRGDRATSAGRDRRIGPTGVAVPVFAFDSAAAASAALRLLDRPDQRRPGPYPFEAAHFAPLRWSGRTGMVRRAFAVPPGAYDVYIVIRERDGSVPPGRLPGLRVLKQELQVPDFSTSALAVSSPILAQRVEAISTPLGPEEQLARPYALGTAEIVPAPGRVFSSTDTLMAVFLVYEAGMDASGKPEIAVDYEIVRMLDDGERVPRVSLHQRFDRESLPAEFDLRLGHQVVPVQPIPFESFPPGEYRLQIGVNDRLTSATVSSGLFFTIR